MKEAIKRAGRRNLAFLGAAVVIVIGLVGFGLARDSDKTGHKAAADSEEEIRDDLTVNPGDLLPTEARCDSDEFLWHSLQEVREGDPAYRQWSDAVSIPFGSSDPDEMRSSELFGEHCGNPTSLTMSIEALSDFTIGGHNIGELNPWMGEYLDAANDPGMREAFLTYKDGEGDTVFVTEEYQQCASMTNTLLMAFQVRGVEERSSVKNWHLPAPTAGELPRAVLNDQQEGLPALVMEYTVKDGCPLVAFGYNQGDKRFEVFPDPVCEEPPPTVTTEPPTETTTPPGTTPTTRPPRTTTTTVPPPTTLPTHPPADGPPPVANQPPYEPPPTTTTPTTAPSNGSPVTVPACGLQGQPSCDNTGVTTPTTVAPPAPPPPNQPPQDGEVEGP